MCDLTLFHDLTDEEAWAVAKAEQLLAEHHARLDARRRAPFAGHRQSADHLENAKPSNVFPR